MNRIIILNDLQLGIEREREKDFCEFLQIETFFKAKLNKTRFKDFESGLKIS